MAARKMRMAISERLAARSLVNRRGGLGDSDSGFDPERDCWFDMILMKVRKVLQRRRGSKPQSHKISLHLSASVYAFTPLHGSRISASQTHQ